MPRPAPRKKENGRKPEKARRKENGGEPAEEQAGFKHYAIMGSLLAGPPLLVLIVFLALSGGRSGEADAGLNSHRRTKTEKSDTLSRREIQEKQIAIKVQRLIGEARVLHEKAKHKVKRFYDLDEPKAKMAAFGEAEEILRNAQEKLDEATQTDRYGKSDASIQELKTLVDRDIHNILKDKPIYLGD